MQVRNTFETDIKLKLNIDRCEESNINTGIGFLDHMLILFAKHGLFSLDVECKGDLHVDYHHTVEDIGLVLGDAFRTCLEDKKGIRRYSSLYTPMDECLTLIAIDISGRPYLNFDVSFKREKVGDFDTELVQEFFRGFVNRSGITLHIKEVFGGNSHHMIESIFKGFGRTLNEASRFNDKIVGVMSTKGVI